MKNKKLTLILAAAVFASGMFLVGMGINAGENREIMNKGVNVCLECIGIG